MVSFTHAPSPRRSLRKRLGMFAVVALILLAVAYVAISLLIGGGVRSIAETAMREHPGDKIDALMAFAGCELHGIRERNRAVWALGQLGDARALPFLERLHTGESVDESRALSQYELKKALVLCRGATNISALVWRHGALSAR